METPLTNYQLFTEQLTRMVKVKEGNNEQFDFDVQLDEMIKKSLAAHKITGAIFSEESGFFEIPGEKRYRVVYDPFCNSSLASRMFREGALGLSVFTDDYIFITAAILDFQTGLFALVEDETTHFYQVQTGEEVTMHSKLPTALEEAWVVYTLEKPDERSQITPGNDIFTLPKRVILSSGHMYWLKLAAGLVDAYLDPIGGEKLYEMFACTVAQKAGCVVTNTEGEVFDPVKYLKIFEQDPSYRFYPVGARSAALHAAIMKKLPTTTS